MAFNRRTFIAAVLGMVSSMRPTQVAARPARSSARGQAPSAGDLVERAGAYVLGYEREFGSVIADEVYQQDVTVTSRTEPGALLRPQHYRWPRRRTLRSEFLMLRPAGATELWRGFRDVITVDGRSAVDRLNLQALFAQRRELDYGDVRRLIDASARYNIGTLTRNVNVPTFALLVVHANISPRFSFTRRGQREVRGTSIWELSFEERHRPTLVRDLYGRDMPTSGTLWVEPVSGRIVRTDLRSEKKEGSVRARIVVDYEPDPKLAMWVPVEMTEDYRVGRPNTFDEQTIYCVARYSNFRRFEVTARIRPE